MSSSVQYFQTSPTTKLRFPSPMTENHWAIEEPAQKILYAVPFIAALMIVACVKPISKKDLFEFLVLKQSVSIELLEKTFKSLVSKKILILTEMHKIPDPLLENFLNWVKSGWDDAANYHFFTWDAPFLDYTKEGKGHEVDRKRMVDYQQLEPDIERYKIYEAIQADLPLPCLNSAYVNEGSDKEKFSSQVRYLLSLTFGKRGEKPCHWTEIPLIRRTSPSGGSRHPTEGYFLSYDNRDIPKGLYHIQTERPTLRWISAGDSEFFERPALNKYSSPYGAIILTSVFERNMYRYREPRTFRTIHMDIGHILSTIELLAKKFGIGTCIHLKFNETSILQHLKSSKLDEGVMAVVTLHEEKV